MLTVDSNEAIAMVTKMRTDAVVSIEVVAAGEGWVQVVEIVTIDGKELMRSDAPTMLHVSDRLNISGAKLDIAYR